MAYFFGPATGLAYSAVTLRIMQVNLVTDRLPGLALAAEPAERGIRHRPLRAPQESLFAGSSLGAGKRPRSLADHGVHSVDAGSNGTCAGDSFGDCVCVSFWPATESTLARRRGSDVFPSDGKHLCAIS